MLTFSGDTGTVVYTQMKVLENLPIMLTSPRIWEALGLPLTPFEDRIDFFADPGQVDEDSIRPYVAMKAQLLHANCDERHRRCTQGAAVIGSNGQPVIGLRHRAHRHPELRALPLGAGVHGRSAERQQPELRAASERAESVAADRAGQSLRR